MKRFALIIVLVAAAVFASNATAAESYLYFMVSDAQFKNGEKANFDYATVKFEDSDSYLSLYDTGGTAAGTKVASDGVNSTAMAEYGFGYYAGFSGDASALTFLVELWSSENNATSLAWQTFEGSSVLENIFNSANNGGANPLTVTTVVPEPTSALLLLLGAAALALRRRSRRALFGVAVSMAVFAANAAQNDLLISFSTKGPDTYADGTTVMDGECYALVWIPEGASGAAIEADGTAADGAKIVLVAPIAKNGRCPNVVYRVGAERVASEFKKGSWSVYLLDTRRYSYGEAGEPVVTLAGIKPDGTVRLINASSKVGDATLKADAGDNFSLAAAVATSATRPASIPDDAPQPKIAGIEVKGGNVYVTVENAAPYLAYDLSSGDTPEAVTERVNDPRHGGDDGMVILVAPAKEGGAFFKVGLN